MKLEQDYIPAHIYALRHEMRMGQVYKWLNKGKLDGFKGDDGRWRVRAVQELKAPVVSQDPVDKREIKCQLDGELHARLEAFVGTTGGTLSRHVRKAIREYLDKCEREYLEATKGCSGHCETGWHPRREA